MEIVGVTENVNFFIIICCDKELQRSTPLEDITTFLDQGTSGCTMLGTILNPTISTTCGVVLSNISSLTRYSACVPVMKLAGESICTRTHAVPSPTEHELFPAFSHEVGCPAVDPRCKYCNYFIKFYIKHTPHPH